MCDFLVVRDREVEEDYYCERRLLILIRRDLREITTVSSVF